MCDRTATHRRAGCYLWRTRVTGQSGQELLEAALVIPMLLMLLIGIVWMARAYNTYETMTRAAREGARFAITPTCVTCGNILPSDAEVQAVIEGALEVSALDPADLSSFSLTRGVVLNPGSPLAERGVVLTFNYPFQFVLPFTSLNMTTITLTTTVQMREE